MIATGGDTTSTALSGILFYLSRNPSAKNYLTHLLRSTFLTLPSIRLQPLQDIPYLRACIDESLRPLPPSPTPSTAMQANPAPQSASIITFPQISPPALHHNTAYFPDPFAFRPERCTLNDPDQIALAKSAFAPFSLGPRSCIAKHLAYAELTLALGWLMWLADFEPVVGKEDAKVGAGAAELGYGRHREGEFQLRDQFKCD
ncbi:MAG: hypothetical protein M1834_007374 [Cirrosporium novae-zelandiae]|nr:MAG: hypothetical protein M1834_007374 [Cirrosporium novae-zelandiae]